MIIERSNMVYEFPAWSPVGSQVHIRSHVIVMSVRDTIEIIAESPVRIQQENMG